MVLDGVSLDVRAVHRLVTILDGPPGRKLVQALFFSAAVVALTHEERLAVLAALEGAPSEFEEVRDLFLAGDQWAGAAQALT